MIYIYIYIYYTYITYITINTLLPPTRSLASDRTGVISLAMEKSRLHYGSFGGSAMGQLRNFLQAHRGAPPDPTCNFEFLKTSYIRTTSKNHLMHLDDMQKKHVLLREPYVSLLCVIQCHHEHG
jgi:hypothetical protein